MVAQNAEGQLVGDLNGMIWSDNAKSLEAQSVLEGITMALDKGMQEIDVETDSHNVIAQIRGMKLSWRLKVICDNINSLASKFWQVR